MIKLSVLLTAALTAQDSQTLAVTVNWENNHGNRYVAHPLAQRHGSNKKFIPYYIPAQAVKCHVPLATPLFAGLNSYKYKIYINKFFWNALSSTVGELAWRTINLSDIFGTNGDVKLSESLAMGSMWKGKGRETELDWLD